MPRRRSRRRQAGVHLGAYVCRRSSLVGRVNQAGFGATAGDFIDGVGGFAVVIRHPVAAKPFAALSVASLVSRMPPSRGKEILPLLRASVRKVEAALTSLTDLPSEG